MKEDVKNREIDEFFKFLKVANDVCKEKGKSYEFECPLCKGRAEGIKNNYNGHLWAKCEKCNMTIME